MRRSPSLKSPSLATNHSAMHFPWIFLMRKTYRGAGEGAIHAPHGRCVDFMPGRRHAAPQAGKAQVVGEDGMRLKRLSAIVGAVGVALAAFLGLERGALAQQDYPNRTVKVVIAFSPAGAIDILGRLIADLLRQQRGQQVIVETRPGAGGNMGAAAAAQAAPDGY